MEKIQQTDFSPQQKELLDAFEPDRGVSKKQSMKRIVLMQIRADKSDRFADLERALGKLSYWDLSTLADQIGDLRNYLKANRSR